MQELIEMVLGYLRGIWRNRWYALACAWLVCVVGWTMVSQMPDQYRASARVYVDTQSILRPLMRGMAVDVNPGAQIGLVTRTLLSRPNLEKIARMTDLDVQSAEGLEGAIGRLQGRVSLVSQRGDTNLFTVAYNDLDPQLARSVVQAVVTVFGENLLGDTRLDTDAAQRFLDRQISEYENRLVEAEERRREFRLRNMGLMPREGSSYYNRMQQASVDLEAIQLEISQAENRRDSLLQQIDGVKPTVEQSDFDGSTGFGPTLPIDGRIQGLEQKLDELLLRYTEKHPDVIILRQTIADLRIQREEAMAQYAASQAESSASGVVPRSLAANPIYQQMRMALSLEEANLAALRAKAIEYEKRRDQLEEMVNAVLQVETQLAALNRDYDLNRSRYNDLLSRRESARMAEQIGQTDQEVRFRIIDPPRVPSDPSGPNRPLLMSGVLVAGLGVGVGVAFLITLLWPTFDTRRSLMKITEIPVFGSVSAVLSPQIIRRERLMVAAYASLTGVLLLTYAGLLVVETVGFPSLL